MRLKIELRRILCQLIILEMFLQLDWSPPVVNSIVCTSFGKAHTCLYEVPQLTVNVRQKPSHEVKGIARRAQRKNCVEAQIWGRVPNHFCSIKCPQEHSGLHHSEMDEVWNNQDFLELAAWPNWAIGEEKGEVYQTAPKGISDHENQDLTIWALMPSVTSGGNMAPSLRWSMVVAASCCGDVFQQQGLGD